MPDPGEAKKRIKKQYRIQNINIRTSTKQQQNNIIPFPSFIIANKTEKKKMKIKHTQTHLPTAQKNGQSRLRQEKNKVTKQNIKYQYSDVNKQQQNNIIPFPSYIIANKTEKKRNENQTHTNTLTVCAEIWSIPVKTRKE